MTKWMLAAGAAALAIVSPALAQHGGGHGGGGGNKGQGQAHGGKNGGHGQVAKAGRGGGNGQVARGNGGGMGKIDRGQGGGAMRGARTVEQHAFRGNADRGNGHAGKKANQIARDNDRVVRQGVGRSSLANVDRERFVPRWSNAGLISGYADSCPPGLARKGNGCLPPGQAKKLVGTLLPASLSGSVLAGPYQQWYRDNDDYYYRNDADYIYRVRREGGLIDALFPSYDRDYYYYPVGMNYPSDYNYYNVPTQYSSYYPDGGDYAYRYGDGAIYQVNNSTGVIQGISALLAGDLSVGQQLPPSYGAYNVPMNYRERYYDTNQDWYRYNDGYIYRVDPTTQLVTAVINAIV